MADPVKGRPRGAVTAERFSQGMAKAGETTREQTWERFIRDWRALQESPFYTLWTCAAVDELLSALHERIVVGSPA